jgi:hypothetical protein
VGSKFLARHTPKAAAHVKIVPQSKNGYQATSFLQFVEHNQIRKQKLSFDRLSFRTQLNKILVSMSRSGSQPAKKLSF